MTTQDADLGPTRSIEEIESAECMRLLTTQSVGRLAYVVREEPMIQPVNYIVDGGQVVIRLATGQKLAAIARDEIFAFEVDELDGDTRTGWNVTVTGPADWVSNEAELSRLDTLLKAWASGEKPYFIRIRPKRVSGRRITA
jgi:nitroimidazol reductase NimA-like FMN-containing flavoprotein (pyridoxamine 5'-phosphate oxidase superfamily)